MSVKNNNKHLLAYVTENNGSNKEISLDRSYNDEFNILEKMQFERFYFDRPFYYTLTSLKSIFS